MRILLSTLVILVLAHAGCAGDPEPTPGPNSTTGVHQPYVPLTGDEEASYRQDLARIFDKSTARKATLNAAGGTVADVSGHANVALVKFDEDGAIATSCVDDEQQALDFLATGKTGTDGLEVK